MIYIHFRLIHLISQNISFVAGSHEIPTGLSLLAADDSIPHQSLASERLWGEYCVFNNSFIGDLVKKRDREWRWLVVTCKDTSCRRARLWIISEIIQNSYRFVINESYRRNTHTARCTLSSPLTTPTVIILVTHESLICFDGIINQLCVNSAIIIIAVGEFLAVLGWVFICFFRKTCYVT